MRTITVLRAIHPELRRASVVGMDSTHSYDCAVCGAGISWCADYPRTRRADRFRAAHEEKHGSTDPGFGVLAIVGAVVKRALRQVRKERAARHAAHPYLCDGGSCCGAVHGCQPAKEVA